MKSCADWMVRSCVQSLPSYSADERRVSRHSGQRQRSRLPDCVPAKPRYIAPSHSSRHCEYSWPQRPASTSSASATPSSTCSRARRTISSSSTACGKAAMALIDEARRAAIYDAMGPAVEISGGSAANTIVGRGEPRRARGLRRQGEGRRAWPRVRPRHPRRRRRLRHAAGVGRALDRALLCAGDARRRAHHEHLSRRRAGSASRRHRRGGDRGRPASPIWKAICGTRRTPRRRSSRPPGSPTRPAATWR